MLFDREGLFPYRPRICACSFDRFFRNLLLRTLALALGLGRGWATPANGQFEKFVQPDGSLIELRNAGDEWFIGMRLQTAT
jgi:hypothetical protein